MLKKLFKALTTLTILAGCYFGYIHVFAIVVEQLRATKRTDSSAFRIRDSKSKRESIRYVQEACGPNHWAADEELEYRYYNAERGYWIYAKECERVGEENGVRYDGKRMRLKPFLLITKSRDGKNTKTITSDVAVFDLNEALSFDVSSAREPLKIKHAHLEPNVWVRDDKGTPHDPNDDMKIGPLTTVDYEESTQQITTLLETHVVVQDPEMVATGDGMVMQLRKNESLVPGSTSSGFEGVEWLELLKNVHVVIRDVGKSGIMTGSVQAKKTAPAKGRATTDILRGPDAKATQPVEPVEPTPLDLTCDSKMRVYLPRPEHSVLVGPPAPPAPTLVQFDRNVVVLRGQPDAQQPDQLTCDTLKLSLVPNEKPPQIGKSAPTPSPDQSPAQATEALAQAGPNGKGDAQNKADGESAAKTADDANSGPLGGLTLQRVHATGHAVWLYLPAQGIKLGCNELIHVRQLPYKPDQTYFRGDRTRPLQLEKIDTVTEDGPDHGKITSVTNIWTVDATIFDNGSGPDTANIVAHGPGRLETRPDRDEPVERIAIWQDRLIVQNRLGPKNEVSHKIIDLTGSRPCFIDKTNNTSLDSAFWIQVWLKPKPATSHVGDTDSASSALTNATGTGGKGGVPIKGESAGDQTSSNTGLGGGNLEIEQLHALVDVHLIAPAKTMTARERLDAEFVKAEIASPVPANVNTAPSTATAAPAQDQVKELGQEEVVAQDQAKKPSNDPPMTGSCDRLWARIAVKPKSATDNSSSHVVATTTKTTAGARGTDRTDAEIRIVWMWGNVALHQEPAKDNENDPGQDASGEAIYLDNRGTNKAISYIYQREPNEKTYVPGPLPPARVENKDIRIAAAGTIQVNQGTDQAWVYGPGTLTQMAARGFLVNKSAEEPTDDEPSAGSPDGEFTRQPGSTDSQVKVRTTALMTQNEDNDDSTRSQDKAAGSKPQTRAGRPVSDKVPMTISFSENMEFSGRSVDPEGRPAAQAEFYGMVTAQTEDALLHCERKMITYTDREVPLAQLGKMSQGQSQAKADGEAANDNAEAQPQAELALVYCYRRALAISRKVDPYAPILVQQQRIEADDTLAYDRRTGDFFIPRRGRVYLYDRSDKSSQTPEPDTDSNGNNDNRSHGNSGLTATQRTVSTTSRQTSKSGSGHDRTEVTNGKGTAKRRAPRSTDKSKTDDDLPLILTQVHFNKGMRGRFGAAKENGDADRRWSEFFGNVQTARAKVPDRWTTLDFDRLPSDGLFLTGQTLRVIEEPPPVGSPKTAPSHYYMKAWEKAYAWSNENSIQSDVITYDSQKDLVYAYGEDGHGVNFAQQHAAGQPVSSSSSKAMQLNPKTGELHVIDSDTISLIDKNTGVRPSAAKPIDPYAKKPKKTKKPYKLPTMNIERRGFTGQ